jgi:signal transduction histidine kinase
MQPIPRAALILGLAGVIPFAWGAATLYVPGAWDWGTAVLGARFVGPYVQLAYGAVILSFMSGVLWGFATRTDGARAAAGYALSVIPALWAFFMTGGGPTSAAINLMAGFAALLLLDAMFARWGLAPAWWMRLRLLLTALVLACLGLTVAAA